LDQVSITILFASLSSYLSTQEEGISEFEAMKAEISEFVNKETSTDEEHDWILAFVGRH